MVAEEGKSASEISRKDEIWTGPGGVLSIAGGKLTAYRKMAERIVDLAEERLGRKVSASRTEDEPLIGGDVDPAAQARSAIPTNATAAPQASDSADGADHHASAAASRKPPGARSRCAKSA